MKKEIIIFTVAETVACGVACGSLYAYSKYISKYRQKEMENVRAWMHENYLRVFNSTDRIKVDGAQEVVNAIFHKLKFAPSKKVFKGWFLYLIEFSDNLVRIHLRCSQGIDDPKTEDVQYAELIADYYATAIGCPQ